MSAEHDRIEELLAGYVLLSLTGEDAIEADRLLSEHVPTCPMCRETLVGFQAVSGELALASDPVAPPDLLLPRIRRRLDEPIPAKHPRRGVLLATVAAVVAAVVVLAGLSISLGNRASKATVDRGRLLDAITALQHEGANSVSLTSATASHARADLIEISGPDLERMYVVGHDVPHPAPGYAYQLWIGTNGALAPIGGMFEPEDGLVVVELTIPTGAGYDEVAITEESIGSRPTTPGQLRWHAWI